MGRSPKWRVGWFLRRVSLEKRREQPQVAVPTQARCVLFHQLRRRSSSVHEST
jgi:hypothetical protein